jgi:hypothetical protein
LSRKLLAISQDWSGLRIVLVRVGIGVLSAVSRGTFFRVFGQQRGGEAAIRGDGFEKWVRAGLAVAAEHEVAEVGEEAGFGGREEALGYGDRKFCEDTTDFARGDQSAAWGDEFAGEIGGAKAAVRGVGMRVAEAVAVGVGGEGALASIGEGETAAGEFGGRAQRERGGSREEPFGGLRADILRQMSGTVVCEFGVLGSHAGRIIYCVCSCLVTAGYLQFRIVA